MSKENEQQECEECGDDIPKGEEMVAIVEGKSIVVCEDCYEHLRED